MVHPDKGHATDSTMQHEAQHIPGYRGRVAIAAVAALAMAMAVAAARPDAARAASASDVVERSIASARTQGALPRAEAADLLATWRRAASLEASLRRSGHITRAEELAYTRGVALDLAARGQLRSVPRLRTSLLSVWATTTVMQRSNLPDHEEVIRLPGEQAAFKRYNGRGVQFQPLETFKHAYQRATLLGDMRGARRIADRMLDLATTRGRALTWEYMFEFQGNRPPWTSGMGQGIAIETFALIGRDLGADGLRYRRTADRLLDLFTLPPSAGGVAVRQGRGSWFLLYSGAPQQRILNGHLQVLINLRRSYGVTRSPRTLRVVNAGLRGALPILYAFDTGAWSRYQLGQEADLGYHDFMTGQLRRLGELTEIPQLRDAAHRFATYRRTPPTVTGPAHTAPPIYPLRDGWRDGLIIAWRVDKASSETVRIIDAVTGDVVRVLHSGGGPGRRSIAWDGRTSADLLARPGTYAVSIRSVDIVGNGRTWQLTRPIVVRRDTSPPRVRAATVISTGARSARLAVATADHESGWVAVRVMRDGRLLAAGRAGRWGTVILDVPLSAAALRAAPISVADSAGNRTVLRVG